MLDNLKPKRRRVRPEIAQWRCENPRPPQPWPLSGPAWETLKAWLERRRIAFNAIDRKYRAGLGEDQINPPPAPMPRVERERSSRKQSPKYPVNEVYQSARLAGVSVEAVETRTRPVTRRLRCVTRATLRCHVCGARWVVTFDSRKRWRRCPRFGCNSRLLEH